MAITEHMKAKLAERLGEGKGGRRKVDREDVVRRYLAGETVANLAREYEVSTGAIYQNLKAALVG